MNINAWSEAFLYLTVVCLLITALINVNLVKKLDTRLDILEKTPVHVEVPDTTPTLHDSVTAVIAPHAKQSDGVSVIVDIIIAESQRARLDPILVANIIRVENPWLINDTTSYAGAIGLMQIMPFHKDGYGCVGSMTNDSINICLGTHIFRQYLQESLRIALLRYNGCQWDNCASYANHVTEEL